MHLGIFRSRWIGAIAVTVSLVAFVVACGSDPTPTPEPTATPVPTSTPVPTPTPVPTSTPVPMPTVAPEPTATPVPTATRVPAATQAPDPVATATPESPPSQPAASVRDFVLTPATTGKDLMDALSDEETSCIKTAFGEAVYQILLNTPIMLAGSDPSAAAPLFACLATESVVVLGVSFMDAMSGGWSDETRTCIIDVGLEHPDAVLTGLGMDPGDAAAVAATHPYLVEFYNCFSDREKVEFLVSFQAEVDSQTSTERDLIAVLPESEVACIRDSLTQEQFDMLLETTVHEGFRMSEALAACITEEGYVQVFVAITASQGGGLSDESLSCVADFARNHPHYVALINPDSYDPPAMAPADLVEIADDGVRMWNCLTNEELQRMQGVSLGALSR